MSVGPHEAELRRVEKRLRKPGLKPSKQQRDLAAARLQVAREKDDTTRSRPDVLDWSQEARDDIAALEASANPRWPMNAGWQALLAALGGLFAGWVLGRLAWPSKKQGGAR